jgi:cobalt-zinc-cadmium efflux system membrane fusion protein
MSPVGRVCPFAGVKSEIESAVIFVDEIRMMRRGRRLRRTGVLVCAWLLVTLTAACGARQGEAQGDAPAIIRRGTLVTVPKASPLRGHLDIAPVQRSTVEHRITAPASVEANPSRQAKILPPLAGRVVELLVHPGDAVRKDQELLVPLMTVADLSTVWVTASVPE